MECVDGKENCSSEVNIASTARGGRDRLSDHSFGVVQSGTLGEPNRATIVGQTPWFGTG